jgi:hypothetical protein
MHPKVYEICHVARLKPHGMLALGNGLLLRFRHLHMCNAEKSVGWGKIQGQPDLFFQGQPDLFFQVCPDFRRGLCLAPILAEQDGWSMVISCRVVGVQSDCLVELFLCVLVISLQELVMAKPVVNHR